MVDVWFAAETTNLLLAYMRKDTEKSMGSDKTALGVVTQWDLSVSMKSDV